MFKEAVGEEVVLAYCSSRFCTTGLEDPKASAREFNTVLDFCRAYSYSREGTVSGDEPWMWKLTGSVMRVGEV